MCGVAGLLYKGGATGPVGQQVLRMLDVLGSRGVDGTGVALYGTACPEEYVLRVKLGGPALAAAQARRVQERVGALGVVREATVQHDYLRLTVARNGDVAALAAAVEQADPDVEVFSVGSALEIVKQVGPASVLRETYCLSTFQGTHGIGHTRLATESKVDISHCHPFWARPYPDIAVVHNGQITNYRKLRRLMEMRGVHFSTGNDSEIIGLYLAEHLAAGATLEDAMRRSVDELDGTFTYLVCTAEGIGMAKDFFATKPLVITETEEYVAIASEEIALCTALGGTPRTYQPSAREVSIWRR
ncbi:MAG: glutamine amidotransferase family protein [Chloroflexota bacterium]